MRRLVTRILPLACLAAALVPAAASASSGEFTHSEAKRALNEAQQALGFQAEPSKSREATVALRNLAVALPALEGSERRRAEAILARPTDRNDREYFGDEAPDSPICNAQFCVHWTNNSKNAPDSDLFIQQVIDSMNQTFAVETGTLAWRGPKPDGDRGARNGVGGDGQTDVYLTNLGRRLYGYAAPDPGQSGSQRFAYLVLDNDYVGFPSPPLESMQVTVAHEFNHILQFNYDTLEDLWLFESSATWVEQKVYPDINDYLNFLPPFAKFPQAPMTGRDKVYADCVWNHWLESRYGADVVRDTWADSLSVKPKHDSVAAYNASIKEHGGKSLSRDFAAFAPVTAEWNSSTAFPDAALYPQVKRKGKLGKKGSKFTLDNTSYQLTNVKNPGGKVTLKAKVERGTQSSIALVGREGPTVGGTVTVQSKYLSKGGKATVTLQGADQFERVTAVVVNADGRRDKKGDYTADGAKFTASLKG